MALPQPASEGGAELTVVEAARPAAASLRALQLGAAAAAGAARPAVASLRAALLGAPAAGAARPAVASLREQRAAALALAVDPLTGAVVDPTTAPAPPALRAPLRVVGADELRRVRDAAAARHAAAAAADARIEWAQALRRRALCECLSGLGIPLLMLLVVAAPVALFAGSLSRITAGSCALRGDVPQVTVLFLALTSGLALVFVWAAAIAGCCECACPALGADSWAGLFVRFVGVFMLVAPCVALGLACQDQCDPGTIAVAACHVVAIALPLCVGLFCAGDSTGPEGGGGDGVVPDEAQLRDGVERAAALPYHTAGPRPPSTRATTAHVRSFAKEEALGDGEARTCATCVICSDDFLDGDRVAQLSCGGGSSLAHEFRGAHVFHQTCLALWFRRHTICPLCRSELPSEEAAKVVEEPTFCPV